MQVIFIPYDFGTVYQYWKLPVYYGGRRRSTMSNPRLDHGTMFYPKMDHGTMFCPKMDRGTMSCPNMDPGTMSYPK